ncbi:MAG: magnesium transporter CorA family protein [Saprospiraceae bacterium]|nr:magnesium transporter CorA family protein [Saprospiraceae bacterium]
MIQYYKFQGRMVAQVDGMEEAQWVHLCPPFTENSIEEYAERFNIPIDFIQDSLDIDERSRYEIEEEGKLILINTPTINQSLKENEAIYVTVPIGIITIDNTVITVTQQENPVIDRILNYRFRNFVPSDPSLFILLVFEQNVLWFLECLKRLNLKRNLIEQELYDSSRNEELRQLLKIEKSLVYFVNSLSANDLLMMKMKRTDFLRIREKEPHEDLFEDIIIDNGQALEMSNVYTNILSGTMEAYASIVSNNLNSFIHRLTVITIILMVPTLVASFYGMNLEYLPFSKSRYAFVLLLGISVILGFLLILFLGKNNKTK